VLNIAIIALAWLAATSVVVICIVGLGPKKSRQRLANSALLLVLLALLLYIHSTAIMYANAIALLATVVANWTGYRRTRQAPPR